MSLESISLEAFTVALKHHPLHPSRTLSRPYYLMTDPSPSRAAWNCCDRITDNSEAIPRTARKISFPVNSPRALLTNNDHPVDNSAEPTLRQRVLECDSAQVL
jgi:hypothetical protein